jgi:GT2 family glycosyltransferase/glycosyltransferase involved in cell wall biosynthesis
VKSSAETQTAVCIAGAHRSGTSMLTRLLHACGLYLGPSDALMPPQADNPDGFWEHLGFVALNDELLEALGGAWDLPPKADQNFAGAPRMDSLRMKARLLIENFGSAAGWGWKDPRNSLTLPFWQDLLPHMKTLVMVRNPSEAAYSMRKRNGTSYAFGLRLWEIYNRRLIEAAGKHEQLVTHYDVFFDNPEKELKRIADFIGLPDTKIRGAAELVATKRRHTHFSIDQLLDAGVSGEVVELYRGLIAQASSPGRKTSVAKSASDAKAMDSDLIPGAVSRLDSFVPDRLAQVEHLYSELLEQTEARHKAEMEKLSAHLAHSEQSHKAQVKELTTHLTKTEGAHKAQVKELTTHLAKTEKQYIAQVEEISAHLTKTEAEYHKEIEQLRERISEMNGMLHQRSINLAEDERYIGELTDRLRKQLQNTKRLARLLKDTEDAARKLRTSRRWKMANPGATLKAKLSHRKNPPGYGHLEKIVAAYNKWRTEHPELANIDDEIKAALVPKIPRISDSEPNTVVSGNVVQDTAEVAAASPAASVPLASLRFARHEKVNVSIIIPVFNQLDYTHACLASLQTVEEQTPFEVIIVDDCSTDRSAEVLPQVDGITYVRNEKNSGFVASCNHGAEKARGKYLAFLNNDTLVKPGWLTALVETFAENNRAGIVGSKLVYPDGRLQEAGGIIWRDASGWNYGKSDDAGKPEYNYLREVDYCSGAALMIPKELFHKLGGFDMRYAPGYYEDTDLAFKVRRAGYQVLYQPQSEVVHYEGATGGTDVSAGAKKYQEVNRSTFAETWADDLITRPVNGDTTSLQKLAQGHRNILVIDHHLPMPDRDSGSLRMFQILKLLQQLGHRVTFLPDNLADIPPYTAELQKRGIKVIHHPYVKKIRDYLIAHGSEFDVVVLSRCQFARKHIDDVRLYAPQSRIIFDTVDLHFLREESEARLTSDPDIRRKAQETKQWEYELIDQSDETWVVSSTEQQLLQEISPNKSIQLVSNIVDIPGSKTPFELRKDLLFIGGFQHPPNIDAVLFFLKEIYPLLIEHLTDAKFYIIGDKVPPEIVALANENIIVAGLQRDVRPFFDSVKLSVAPLRFGAGVKGKINQSMAFGVPVVATSVAVEGAGLLNGEEILVADAPEDFAKAIVALYQSGELWKKISENGLKKTRALYSTDAARTKLEFLFSDAHLKNSELSQPIAERELVVASDVHYRQ